LNLARISRRLAQQVLTWFPCTSKRAPVMIPLNCVWLPAPLFAIRSGPNALTACPNIAPRKKE
jgi:hypothetical protein